MFGHEANKDKVVEALLQMKPSNKSIAPDVGTLIDVETHQDNLSLLHHHSNMELSPASPDAGDQSPLAARDVLFKAKLRAQRRNSVPNITVSPLLAAALQAGAALCVA